MSAVVPAGVRFTEEMLGHVTFGETDHHRGAAMGRDGAVALKFHLTIAVDDVERFAADPQLRAEASGYVRSDGLGGRLAVERGVFNLFVDDGSPTAKRMLYRLWFHDGAGHPVTLSGHKLVHNDPGIDVWKDTTTLFVRLLRGHVEAAQEGGAELVASGVLRIRVRDFARQLTTFRTSGASAGARLGALARFGVVFGRNLATVYLRNGGRRHGQA